MQKTLALMFLAGCAVHPQTKGDTLASHSGAAGSGGALPGTTAPPGSTAGGTDAATSGGTSASPGTASGAGTTGGSVAGDPSAQLAGVLTAGVWDDNLNYAFFTGYLGQRGQIAGDPGFSNDDYASAHTQAATRAPKQVVDIAIVMDTTGSMGDEIAYLTAELAHISSAIATAFPSAAQRWALILYRDTPDFDPGDDYVTRTFDFTADLQAFGATVGAQSADGGGDYPESPELGLAELPKLHWRDGAARVAFWIGDAPHHSERGAAMKQAIGDVRATGIHLYPISASGTDDLLELTMRSAAALSGGRYLFLTDDSGVGDPHKTPEIPCFYVTKLGQAIVRTVSMELSASYQGPAPGDVIRAVGDPTPAGTCQTQDGHDVQIF